MSIVRSISHIFPPPQYLSMPAVGVDISDTSLKYIQFKPFRRKGKQLGIKYYGDIDINDGALDRGKVNDPIALAEAIASVREVTKTDFVHVSLPEERAYLFETEIKRGTSFKEIRGLLEFRLEENVPLSPKDAFFDYDIIDSDRDSSMLRVSVTAYARETINAYFEACQAAGVIPLSFQVEAQAIARTALPWGDRGTHMIVDFGKTRTGVGIVHDGALMYTSTIDIGGKELSKAMRKRLGEKEEKELTKLKNNVGLIRTNTEDSAVFEALISPMSAIAGEVSTRIQYWNTRDVRRVDQEVENVILCGGSANLRGLPGYLREVLGVDVELAEVWQNAFSLDRNIPPIDRRHSYGYATAVGLGLTGFQN